MTPRELPNLTIGNCPAMSPEAGLARRSKSTRWLIACSAGLLIAAGVSASLFTQSAVNTKKLKPAVVQPMDRDPAPPARLDPKKETAERSEAPTFELN